MAARKRLAAPPAGTGTDAKRGHTPTTTVDSSIVAVAQNEEEERLYVIILSQLS